ncbi:unnamed protein product, partial [Sphenostylis stenocarpa]
KPRFAFSTTTSVADIVALSHRYNIVATPCRVTSHFCHRCPTAHRVAPCRTTSHCCHRCPTTAATHEVRALRAGMWQLALCMSDLKMVVVCP